ncbi:hypothetical protein NUW58_g8869 [Xylaria curta]|uniref:Uncharacterized protein n=1 Tax=Xylaria curta TaxID=42375 RepID=A0ACC1N365_9PEZI|nr:hypothetical protein NUW58_g8869 [Xylaria curta]
MAQDKKKNIAVMTSGGDSPGMNAVVRAVVRTAIHLGCNAYCVYEGYRGLVIGRDEEKQVDYIRQMGWEDVRGYLSLGGTLIGTARCKEFFERDGRLRAARNMVVNGIDALIIAAVMARLLALTDFVAPFQHLNIVGLVGSIDNDLSGTDATIGAYSALARICEMVDYIEATASSHSRAFVIEVMGRHCGWLALMGAVATGADFLFIPEKPREDNWKEEMCQVIKTHRDLGKRKTIVIIAEGALDRHGNKITPTMVKDLLADGNGLGLDTRITTLGHVQRGGTAVAYDRMLGTLQGVEAVKAVLEATPETETCFIAITENKITRKPLMAAVKETQEVAKLIDAQRFNEAMALRDTEFSDQYKSYAMSANMGWGEVAKVKENEVR